MSLNREHDAVFEVNGNLVSAWPCGQECFRTRKATDRPLKMAAGQQRATTWHLGSYGMLREPRHRHHPDVKGLRPWLAKLPRDFPAGARC